MRRTGVLAQRARRQSRLLRPDQGHQSCHARWSRLSAMRRRPRSKRKPGPNLVARMARQSVVRHQGNNFRLVQTAKGKHAMKLDYRVNGAGEGNTSVMTEVDGESVRANVPGYEVELIPASGRGGTITLRLTGGQA